MYAFEQQIRVQLEFRAMPAPVEVSVPWDVLWYLDTHAERYFAPDGTVVYCNPEQPIPETESERPPFARLTPAMCVA